MDGERSHSGGKQQDCIVKLAVFRSTRRRAPPCFLSPGSQPRGGGRCRRRCGGRHRIRVRRSAPAHGSAFLLRLYNNIDDFLQRHFCPCLQQIVSRVAFWRQSRHFPYAPPRGRGVRSPPEAVAFVIRFLHKSRMQKTTPQGEPAARVSRDRLSRRKRRIHRPGESVR